MKVVLLAGGKGTRITEESEYRPKPLIEMGGLPILWHIMKYFYYYGFNDFIVCAGYKQEMIKKWFSEYFFHTSDVLFDFTNGKDIQVKHSNTEKWKVAVVDTGIDTMTGGRIKKIQEYIEEETFMMTYGDGVCDVNLSDLLSFHKDHGKIATLTSVVLKQDKGLLDVGWDNTVKAFREKSSIETRLINAGYMVLNRKIFDYLEDDTTIFERQPMEKLASMGELMSYQHNGFWQCMDTLRDKEYLENLWRKGETPWKVW